MQICKSRHFYQVIQASLSDYAFLNIILHTSVSDVKERSKTLAVGVHPIKTLLLIASVYWLSETTNHLDLDFFKIFVCSYSHA